jgi:hypothetical protein
VERDPIVARDPGAVSGTPDLGMLGRIVSRRVRSGVYSMAQMKLDGMFRQFVSRLTAEAQADSVAALPDGLEGKFPKLRQRLRDESGKTRPLVPVFVNARRCGSWRAPVPGSDRTTRSISCTRFRGLENHERPRCSSARPNPESLRDQDDFIDVGSARHSLRPPADTPT